VLAGSPSAQIESAVDEFQHFRCTKKLANVIKQSLTFMVLQKLFLYELKKEGCFN
jgi:hypothetical protein